ncbi:hypothetical protein IFM89_006579 [Coptis chinensis]|uniref:Uncharacterized protein n=1 Tax=Coptis chinensis TaxID=261450 RepID=A0A835IMS8_9MAGN|nr:hypothetical protein IFM89_006579 [Coptis chinensis]
MEMVSDMCLENPKKEITEVSNFDMGALSACLPKKRKGLSTYYTGKSQSFTSLADVHCLEDLKKPEIPQAKKRKYLRRENTQIASVPCRRISNSNHFAAPFVGF